MSVMMVRKGQITGWTKGIRHSPTLEYLANHSIVLILEGVALLLKEFS